MTNQTRDDETDRAPTDSVEVRADLVDALKLDLIGPWADHALADERLPGWMRPSIWYLTGFLIPSGSAPEHRGDDDEQEDFGEITENAGLNEESNEERKTAKKGYFPSSMGLSFLVPKEADELNVTVRWGDYVPVETEKDQEAEDEEEGSSEEDAEGHDEGGASKVRSVWQRTSREETIPVPLTGASEAAPSSVPESGGLQLYVIERPLEAKALAKHIPAGTRAVSVFLVNNRSVIEGNPDRAYAFQAEIEVRSASPFFSRPDLSETLSKDWDERVSDLHYADTPEYATGHGISADWDVEDGVCRLIRTTWTPTAEVEKTETVALEDVELSMSTLGALEDGAAALGALSPLVQLYRTWIDARQEGVSGLEGTRRETAEELLRLAGVAANRVEQGIQTLASDEYALDAFRVANRAVSRTLSQRLQVEDPQWRPFQIAFILLNLPGLTDPSDPNRETVDLLFFPTGGGKTEAYLGLAAITIVLRRLNHPGEDGLEGAGVSVIMRYTLRLLTLDQLARAAGLVCALELEREADPDRYGTWPFEIGLWVGKAATPNRMGHKGDGRQDSARTKVRQYKADPKNRPSPIPLENCPWCDTRFAPESFALLDNKGGANDDQPTQLRVVCVNFECDFTRDRALPIVAVDEPIYRRLPAFLIATVDKFASLPWVGQSGALLGGANRHDSTGFYSAADLEQAKRLGQPLPPPDLIIQDELHLISGPLGTMTGLYEAAIEALCVREAEGRTVRPKIVASTATVRRAQDQIQALFGRPLTQVFPPPGPDRRDSFFAQMLAPTDQPARLYMGLASQGRSPKVLMRKAWVALMGAGQRAFLDSGGTRNKENPADPYMTVLGYFNSLRELGGARRILEEEVQNTIRGYGNRRRIGEARGLFRDRKNFAAVLELTSRVPTDVVAEARRRLARQFHDSDSVDCALATNMISVGLDIQRLGLMVVFGQPKTSAEYIQATSRVGRDANRPGLVVTLFNIHKPRDRSHLERFRHYHESFYREVEVGSVTPFSARALDRGFAGALVTLARHVNAEMTSPQGVSQIVNTRPALERALLDAFLGRIRQQPFEDEREREERLRSVQDRTVDLLDSWRGVVQDYKVEGVSLQYQQYEMKQARPLLMEMLEKEDNNNPERSKFRVNRSMREVEPQVNLILKELAAVPQPPAPPPTTPEVQDL